jgi:GNAT superfamily N-acetyltransferase
MRLRMRADLREPRPAPEDPLSRQVRTDDRPALTSLMLAAYRGTVDDEGEGPDGAAAEVARVLEGAYGPFDTACSEVVVRDGAVVSATLVTDYEGCPLVAYSMTAPEWKRRGLARAGLLRVMARVRRAGRGEVGLAVTDSNTPARRLYESLGFVEAPARHPSVH